MVDDEARPEGENSDDGSSEEAAPATPVETQESAATVLMSAAARPPTEDSGLPDAEEPLVDGAWVETGPLDVVEDVDLGGTGEPGDSGSAAAVLHPAGESSSSSSSAETLPWEGIPSDDGPAGELEDDSSEADEPVEDSVASTPDTGAEDAVDGSFASAESIEDETTSVTAEPVAASGGDSGSAPPPPIGGGGGSPGGDGEEAPKHTTALGVSIFTTLCCCLPGGIGALIFAMQAKTAVANGDYATAESKIKTSYIFSGVSMVIGVMVILLNIIAVILQEM